MKRHTVPLFVLVLASLLFAAVASAQEDDVALDCEHPRVVYVIEKTGASCEEIQALRDDGVGLGLILKAAVVAEGLEGYDGTWRTLLEEYREDIGWGGLARAFGLASAYPELELTGERMLELKTEQGLGWGEIRKAQAIAAAEDLPYSFDEAIQMVKDGVDWEEIRDELGLPQQPPPWAGGPDKDKDKVTGPPDWANNDKSKDHGPPDWASNDKAKDKDDDSND